MEGSDSNPSLCPLTVCGCAIRRRASQSNSQLKSRMERIPLSATHKSTLTQESLKGGVQPLNGGSGGRNPQTRVLPSLRKSPPTSTHRLPLVLNTTTQRSLTPTHVKQDRDRSQSSPVRLRCVNQRMNIKRDRAWVSGNFYSLVIIYQFLLPSHDRSQLAATR